MRPGLAAAFTLVLATAAPALADDIPGCDNETLNNMELDQCAGKAFKAADAELNQVWPKVLAFIDGQKGNLPDDAVAQWKATMIAAQRAWVTFKENDCNAVQYEWYGGSGASLAVTSCLYHHTADRLADLKERYLDR
ncbi:MAG: DUF1311 domain-containing protein [Bauldia sp.]|nr:DUF1311 domain-containing protein [Bauldia sp.]